VSQAIGQLSIVLATPFLTRLFSPEELGRYQLAFTIGILLQPVVTLRFEFLIPSEKNDAAIPKYMRMVIGAFLTVTSVLVSLALLGMVFFSESFAVTVVMIAVIAISYALTALDNALLIRQKAMNRLAIRNLLSGTLAATLQVVFAYMLRDVIWIAFAILIGRLVAILTTRMYGLKGPQLDAATDNVRLDWGRTLYGISSGVVSSLSLNALVFYSQVSFGLAATAYVGVAQRSASAPLGFISQALSQSVQATIGEAVRVGDTTLLRHVRRETLSMLPYAVVTTLALVIFGPLLAVPIFGSGWETTGRIIAVLGIPAGLQLLVSPITPVFFMLGAERRLFWIQISRLLLAVFCAVSLQLAFGDLVYAVAGYSLGLSLGYIYTYVALSQEIRKLYPG
jgi:O-antigen/teichoic acid export membrane protein